MCGLRKCVHDDNKAAFTENFIKIIKIDVYSTKTHKISIFLH